MINFKGKKILITGATGGIGNSLVKKFLTLEGTVLATGTNSEKLDALKREFPNISLLKFDISEHSKIEDFIENRTEAKIVVCQSLHSMVPIPTNRTPLIQIAVHIAISPFALPDTFITCPKQLAEHTICVMLVHSAP